MARNDGENKSKNCRRGTNPVPLPPQVIYVAAGLEERPEQAFEARPSVRGIESDRPKGFR